MQIQQGLFFVVAKPHNSNYVAGIAMAKEVEAVALELYPHNQKAYAAAMDSLRQSGKAAIVHPTGTGKSFIGFCLARQHPTDRVLWLTPSEYIVRTQLENLQRASGWQPGNIQFLTYAKLMTLVEEELDALDPKWIVLDEFHRCGAEKWGEGVQRLLQQYPRTPLLGLSATNVRYLDNQRDMAEELFDGQIASYMTLGEAVVRGILPAPVYVTSVYAYQKELARMEERVRGARGAGLERQNEKYLEALRRALEKADGLSEVFRRHIPRRDGRYICFCASHEHLEEMAQAAPGWFAGVDEAPHLYRVYSDDPDASTDFQNFKQDDSDHLKLLFCIDMLNEGIHVEGIDGVVMFRPTVSPIVYKQQLGRALAAGGRQPVVFDVVNNFENLYSISTMQEEMRTAVQLLYGQGLGGEVVTERFRIIDEVQECRALFQKLGESLASSWEIYYAAAAEYRRQHGDLLAPKRYKTGDGLSLGSWLGTQRAVRSGRAPGVLTEEQIARLDAIGMQWENRLELAWERGYAHAQAYFEEFGDLDVPARYVAADGFALGKWIINCRQRRAGNTAASVLTEERVARLDAIGMIWRPFSLRWEQNYLAAAEYYAEHGDLEMPLDYCTPGGLALGKWIFKQRALRAGTTPGAGLTEEQIDRLNAIGMRWETNAERQWSRGFEAARRYYEQHGNLKLPVAYTTPDGVALGKWVRRQQYALENPDKSNCKLTPGRVRGLAKLGLG